MFQTSFCFIGLLFLLDDICDMRTAVMDMEGSRHWLYQSYYLPSCKNEFYVKSEAKGCETDARGCRRWLETCLFVLRGWDFEWICPFQWETWTTLSHCGSSSCSSCWTPATSSSSAGPMRKESSSCSRRRRWPGCGEPERTNPTWTTTSSAGRSDTTTTR